jgi:hypothetical protein
MTIMNKVVAFKLHQGQVAKVDIAGVMVFATEFQLDAATPTELNQALENAVNRAVAEFMRSSPADSKVIVPHSHGTREYSTIVVTYRHGDSLKESFERVGDRVYGIYSITVSK